VTTYDFISERELTFTFALCRRPSVCRLSVTFVHPILRRLKFSAMLLRHLVPCPPIGIQVKFVRRSSQGTPPSEELNTRGVAEYSDCGPIERYSSETV